MRVEQPIFLPVFITTHFNLRFELSIGAIRLVCILTNSSYIVTETQVIFSREIGPQILISLTTKYDKVDAFYLILTASDSEYCFEKLRRLYYVMV